MKLKKVLASVLIGVMALSLVACGKKPKEDNKDVTTTPEVSNEETQTPEGTEEALKGTVVITGSTSVEKILVDMIDEFEAQNPDVSVNYTGTGSSAGIQDTISGANTIGVASREIKDEETSQGVKATTFAFDGIAVAVNPENSVENITLEDLAKIYSGEVTNWNQLGGADAPIEVVSREGASGTRSAFEELIKLEDVGGLVETATVVEGNGNVQASVASNKNAIGYVSFSYIDETVKELSVEGVKPTAEDAKEGTYKLSRPFLFTTVDGKVTKEAQAFIDFALSQDGQVYVEEHGGIRID